MIPLVVASERGLKAKLHACDTRQGLRVWGCGDKLFCCCRDSRVFVCVRGSGVESPAVDGESPVPENVCNVRVCFPSSSGLVESAVNLPGPPGKPKYSS